MICWCYSSTTIAAEKMSHHGYVIATAVKSDGESGIAITTANYEIDSYVSNGVNYGSAAVVRRTS